MNKSHEKNKNSVGKDSSLVGLGQGWRRGGGAADGWCWTRLMVKLEFGTMVTVVQLQDYYNYQDTSQEAGQHSMS